MSFDTMKISELKGVAEGFGIELEAKATKQSIILAMQEEGITYDTYAKFSGLEQVEQEEPVELKKKVSLDRSKTILVKMDKANPSYTIGQYLFTQQHPFVPMSEEDAQIVFDAEPGFRPATPREVTDFYN